MNRFTEAVNYVQKYVDSTEPIFATAQGKFAEVQGQLEFALQVLKEHKDYEDAKTVRN